MDIKQILRDQIKNYLIENPIDRSKPNCYVEVAKQFGVDSEYIRTIYKKLRAKGLVEAPISFSGFVQTVSDFDYKPITSVVTINGEAGYIEQEINTDVKNEEDLARECNIDLTKWTITGWECKRYNAWIKNTAGEIESEPKFSVHAKLKKRSSNTDALLQKQILLDEIKDYVKSHPGKPAYQYARYDDSGLLLVSIPDIHFGKLGWREETGEDYDIKIAEERFTAAVDGILSRTNLQRVERILFPVGNDLINVDNLQKTTTAGTPQDTDIRFPKIIKLVRRILVETIDRLSQVAPVDVIIIPGNHDQQTTFMMGEILDAYYANNKNVIVDNDPKLRKYYQYGNVGIQWTHGDKEKHEMLGLIFATEQPQLWANTKYRFCQLGHFHKNKKLNFVSVDEHQGFQVQIIPSLSGTDAWHAGKGYQSLKQAKGFLYDKEQGLIAEYTYTV